MVEELRMNDLLTRLTRQQALEVLRRLDARGGEIRRMLMSEARAILEEIELDEIAEEVFFVLDLISVEDLWDRSGASRDGYISSDEAAVEMIEEELKPFLEQFRDYRRLDMPTQETIYCMGLLLGIHRFDQESKSEFREWAGDIPGECFVDLLDEWRKSCSSAELHAQMNDFLSTGIRGYRPRSK
jgi:hypothetical protein